MAYSDAWDEGVPLGTAAANTLDTIIQNLKRSMRERLEDSFPDWTDDAVDPKRVVVHSGTLANRPSGTDPNAGEVYLATDTAQVFVYDGSGWQQISNSAIWASYDDTKAVGNKVTSEGAVDLTISLTIQGTTDGSGDLIVDMGEIGIGDVDLGLSVGRFYQPVSTSIGWIEETTVGGSTITLRFKNRSDAALTGTPVNFRMLMVQRA